MRTSRLFIKMTYLEMFIGSFACSSKQKPPMPITLDPRDVVPPQFHQLQICQALLSFGAKRPTWIYQSLLKSHQSGFFFNSMDKKGTKYSSHERTDIFKEVKTRKQIEVLRCLEWYKSRLVSKHTLPKDPFLHTTLIKERKRHFPLHWLFVFDHYLYLLVHSFLPMAFMREMSFGSLAFSLSPFFE